jgi:hypothetical protein
MKKTEAQEIQLRQEDELISMINNKKVHLSQFELVSIPIRTSMTKATCNRRKTDSQGIELRKEYNVND